MFMNSSRKLAVALAVCLASFVGSATALAADARHDTRADIEGVLADSRTQGPVRVLLGSEYERFIGNFETLAVPSALKSGGTYLEGWRDNQHLKQTSSLLVYPDGRVHAAYYVPETHTLRYFTNEAGVALHPAIAVWLKQFDASVRVVRVDGGVAQPVARSGDAVKAEPTVPQQEELRQVAAIIWTQSLADGWNMYGSVGDLLSQATQSIITCAARLTSVPPPANFQPGWPYLASNRAAVVQYIGTIKQHRTYKTCVSSAASNYRTAVELASAEG